MNGAERSAFPTDIFSPTAVFADSDERDVAGGRRTKSAAGTSVAHTSTASTTCALRQSICVMSHAANGDIVIGATPTPTETSDTARPRCSVIQPITAAIIGVKKLPMAMPTSRPNASWNCSALCARLARKRPSPRSTAPASTTGRGPMRSLSAPQPKPAAPIARKPIVMALDTCVCDQPVAWVIGCRNTASENMAPIAMHVMKAPIATMTQPYLIFIGRSPWTNQGLAGSAASSPCKAGSRQACEDCEAERPAHHERGVDDARGEAGFALLDVAHGDEQHRVHRHAAADSKQRHAGQHVEGEAALDRRQREERESGRREQKARRERQARAEAHHHLRRDAERERRHDHVGRKKREPDLHRAVSKDPLHVERGDEEPREHRRGPEDADDVGRREASHPEETQRHQRVAHPRLDRKEEREQRRRGAEKAERLCGG